MRDAFSNVEIECWPHDGNRLGKPGHSPEAFCLFHRSVDLGRPLLAALDEVAAEERLPARRSITLRGSQRKGCCGQIRLLCVPRRPELQLMSLTADSGVLQIELTAAGVSLLRESLANWLAGSEDFGLGWRHSKLKKQELGPLDLASSELWFWGPEFTPSSDSRQRMPR